MMRDTKAAGRHLSAALKSDYEDEAALHLQKAIEHYETALKLARAALASIRARLH